MKDRHGGSGVLVPSGKFAIRVNEYRDSVEWQGLARIYVWYIVFRISLCRTSW